MEWLKAFQGFFKKSIGKKNSKRKFKFLNFFFAAPSPLFWAYLGITFIPEQHTTSLQRNLQPQFLQKDVRWDLGLFYKSPRNIFLLILIFVLKPNLRRARATLEKLEIFKKYPFPGFENQSFAMQGQP